MLKKTEAAVQEAKRIWLDAQIQRNIDPSVKVPSLQDLAEIVGVSLPTIKRAKANDDWEGELTKATSIVQVTKTSLQEAVAELRIKYAELLLRLFDLLRDLFYTSKGDLRIDLDDLSIKDRVSLFRAIAQFVSEASHVQAKETKTFGSTLPSVNITEDQTNNVLHALGDGRLKKILDEIDQLDEETPISILEEISDGERSEDTA